jgi:hypothetical protein
VFGLTGPVERSLVSTEPLKKSRGNLSSRPWNKGKEEADLTAARAVPNRTGSARLEREKKVRKRSPRSASGNEALECDVSAFEGFGH